MLLGSPGPCLPVPVPGMRHTLVQGLGDRAERREELPPPLLPPGTRRLGRPGGSFLPRPGEGGGSCQRKWGRIKEGRKGQGRVRRGHAPRFSLRARPTWCWRVGDPSEGHRDPESRGQRWGTGKGRSGETGQGTETPRGTWGRSRSPHPQVFPFGVGPPCLQQQQARSPVSSQQWVAGRLLGTPLSGYLVSGAALTWWGPPDGQCTNPKEKAPTAVSILCSDDLDEDSTCSSLGLPCGAPAPQPIAVCSLSLAAMQGL